VVSKIGHLVSSSDDVFLLSCDIYFIGSILSLINLL
jgi:hypothetical protein